MMLGIHDVDIAAESAPELAELFDGCRVGAGRRRQDTPPPIEEFGEAGIGTGLFSPRNGMRGYEMNALQYVGSDIAHHSGLHGANIGQNRIALQERRYLFC